MSNNIRLSESKAPDPAFTRRITAIMLLFIILALLLFAINKYNIDFITITIFLSLLLIPVIASFEKDITNFLGLGGDTIREKKKETKRVKINKPRISSKTYKYFILILVILGILGSLYLMYKSYKLEEGKKDLIKLVLANLILINCGTIISITFN